MDSSAHVLFVWNDLRTRDQVADMLGQNDLRVISVTDGAEMRRLLGAGGIDLLILDVSTAREDAANRWHQVCSAESPPVIMLAAPGSDPTAIVALQAGAADYITKPFKSRELLARVRGVLRRFRAPAPEFGQADHRDSVEENGRQK